MDVLELTRLQFAVVTIYHYLFVPLSISLSATTAGLQIAWMRTGKDHYRQLTLLVGKLLIVTFAVGVVTGLVQEFQFGLAWSEFARFYGDVFGPTLAIEGMLAFFLEATFLALWYFGWDRLSRRVHLATIVVVAVGTLLSAFIILAANSFMQHPVAYELDPATGRAHLTSFRALLFNEVNLAAFPHTTAGAIMVGGAFLLAVGAWRSREAAFSTLARIGAWMTVAGGALTAITGDHLGKVITQVQPMKMAAAEALYSTTTGAPFSLFAIGGPDGGEPFFSIEVPGCCRSSPTATRTPPSPASTTCRRSTPPHTGPGSYIPMVPVAFWTFRAMIGAGVLAMLLAALYLWRTRRGHHPGTWLVRTALLLPLLPAAANSLGWIFTETARQPWIAFGLSKVADGISSGPHQRRGPRIPARLHRGLRRPRGRLAAPRAARRPPATQRPGAVRRRRGRGRAGPELLRRP